MEAFAGEVAALVVAELDADADADAVLLDGDCGWSSFLADYFER